ncbi:hypothetical protein BAY06_04805 [Elizabethkingia anophelis]|uniref:adenylate/guanylate cyclase domain-containing protein n=1 Tax=Elizabethkingia anophelis TaxID=1117645 RepID=UPI00099ACC31|nr:adenylate/guanylate cyclase domain-containing protein [Elizabethkingia anophelis]OPC51645.1 hypothetical protein BAY06_04805 [Elizabethkingia anophelis]
MNLKDLIEEINNDVIDITQTGFEYINTNLVPNRGDNQLTFGRGVTKRGKILRSCVLYVDIRNSVALTEKHHTQTMGRIYSAFTKAVLKAAKHHFGHIRNIIGDRVMIVFPSKNCFVNAVHCAITINHISKNIINKQFKEVDFKCGIGIDYGDLKVIKVGLQRRNNEGTENRSLVWVGYPANIASRLTDAANKIVTEDYFEVTRNKINPRAIKPMYALPSKLLLRSPDYDPSAPLYLPDIETVEVSTEEFANNIRSFRDGELYMLGGKFIKFSKKVREVDYPAILITKKVFDGYKNDNPNGDDIKNSYWKEQKHNIKNVSGNIFGSMLTWKLT